MEPKTLMNTESIRKWLGSFGMSQYANNFEENGYDDMECMWNLNSDDLEQIGVGLAGHRRKLLNHASRLEFQFAIKRKDHSISNSNAKDDADLSYEIWRPDFMLGISDHFKSFDNFPAGIDGNFSSFISGTAYKSTMDETANISGQNEADDVFKRLDELSFELENELNPEIPIHGEKGIQLNQSDKETRPLVSIEIFNEDLSRSVSIEIEEYMQSWYVTHLLLVQQDLTDSPNWGIIEVIPHLSIQRMLEDHEILAATHKDRSYGEQSLLLLKKDDYKYDLFQRRYEYFPAQLCLPNEQTESLDPRLESARRMLIDSYLSGADNSPELRGLLFLKEGKKSWRQKYIELRASGLYYSRVAKSRQEKHLSLLCCIDSYDAFIAANYRKATGAPSEFCFVLKPRGQRRKLSFVDLKCFSAPSKRVMFSWLAGIRLMRHGGAQLRDNFVSICDKKSKLELRRREQNKQQETFPCICNTQTEPKATVQLDHSLATANTNYFDFSQLTSTSVGPLAALSSNDESAITPRICILSHSQSNERPLYTTPSESINDSGQGGDNSSCNPWFHGVISKDESAIRIRNVGGANGTFLIRESTSRRGSYVLTMIFQHKFYHYIIHNHGSIQNALFAIDYGPRFTKLQDVYQYYSICSDGMPCRLSQLCLKVSTEVSGPL